MFSSVVTSPVVVFTGIKATDVKFQAAEGTPVCSCYNIAETRNFHFIKCNYKRVKSTTCHTWINVGKLLLSKRNKTRQDWKIINFVLVTGALLHHTNLSLIILLKQYVLKCFFFSLNKITHSAYLNLHTTVKAEDIMSEGKQIVRRCRTLRNTLRNRPSRG